MIVCDVQQRVDKQLEPSLGHELLYAGDAGLQPRARRNDQQQIAWPR